MRIRSADESAFQELFTEYYAALVSFAERYTRNSATAEEVVDDVFVRLWEIRAEWTPTTSVRAYLFGAVRNRALSALRQRRMVEKESILDLQALSFSRAGTSLTTPDVELDQLETERHLWDAVEELSEQERMILRLRWREGLTWDEVATILQISVASAQMKHTRCLRVLRNKLRRHFS